MAALRLPAKRFLERIKLFLAYIGVETCYDNPKNFQDRSINLLSSDISFFDSAIYYIDLTT